VTGAKDKREIKWLEIVREAEAGIRMINAPNRRRRKQDTGEVKSPSDVEARKARVGEKTPSFARPRGRTDEERRRAVYHRRTNHI